MTGRGVPLGVALIAHLALFATAPGAAQDTDPPRFSISPNLSTVEPPDVPFGPGERMEYKVKLGIFNVGDGFMSVSSIDTIRGRRAYHLTMGLDASHLFGAVKVRDRFDSWLDIHTLSSLRFHKDQHEVSYKSRKKYEIFPGEQRWGRGDEGTDSGPTVTEQPLDEIAFMYFIRTLPLKVGDVYTFDHYFKEDGNPVVIRVLRKERKEVPAGTFETVVVQPIIQTDGLFSEGGNAEIYFTDDEERRIVYLRSEIPLVGSITLHLERVIDESAAAPTGG